MIGFFYVGDPFAPATVRIGPLTIAPCGNGISLQNTTGADLKAGIYVVPNGQYLNKQAGQPYGVLGIAGVASQWETWKQNGATVTSWDGYVYGLGVPA